MRERPTPLVLLLFLCCLITNCDRENEDILIDEEVEEINPTVTNFTYDHVQFNENQYVHTTPAHASECDLFDPLTGDYITTAYFITNLEDFGPQGTHPQEEGDFYILYNQNTEGNHLSHIVVNVGGVLTQACPDVNGLDINLIETSDEILSGTFSGDFEIFNPVTNDVESIGELNGNFHVPMVPCQ